MRKACLLAVAAGLAQVSFAQVNITQTFPIDAPILEDLTVSRQSFTGADLFINGFNPALGTLKAVTITSYGNVVINTPVENDTNLPISGDLSISTVLNAGVTLQNGTFLTAVGLTATNTRVITAPARSDRLFSNRHELYGTVRITNTPENAPYFRYFSAPGPVVLQMRNFNTHTLPAGTRVSRDIPPQFGIFGRFRGTIRITYTYIP